MASDQVTGPTQRTGTTLPQKIGGAIVVAVAALVLLSGVGSLCHAIDGGNSMAEINAQVLRDHIGRYEIAKKNGTPMDACSQAQMVKAAALQAHDEPAFQRWTAIEKVDCAAAELRGQ